jgi:hypothetical protein
VRPVGFVKAGPSDIHTSLPIVRANAVTEKSSRIYLHLLWIAPVVAFVGWSIYPTAQQLGSVTPTETVPVSSPGAYTVPTAQPPLSDSAEAQRVLAPLTPAIQPIHASQIVAEYQANEVAADARYKDKRLTISGTVGRIAKDIMDEPYITLDDDEFGLRSVQAYFDNSDLPQLGRLTKGQVVTIEGTCDGLMMNVLIRKTHFVSGSE